MTEAVNQNGASQVDGATGSAIRSTDPPGARLARWLWPPRCLVCGDRGARGLDLCQACAEALPWLGVACCRCALPLPAIASVAPASRRPGAAACGTCLQQPPPLTEAHAACLYAPPLDRLLPRFKFHHDLATGRLLALLMAHAFAPLASNWAQPAVLLPIPLHPRRLRQRGYDQALELARPLARALQLPLLERTLTRARDTAAQSRLHADQRQRNLRNAFAVTTGAALPAHVVLVDDVMTTGATLHAAAQALRRAGVERVDAWVCARAP